MRVQSKQYRHNQQKSLSYKLYLPAGYHGDEQTRWPLVLFLHGAGERGDNLEDMTRHGIPKKLEAGEDLPFIVIAPQCPLEMWWHNYLDLLLALLQTTAQEYRVDASRLYLTGLSMGGHGVWDLATTYPDTFAAIAPICAWGHRLFGYPERAARVAHIPVWAFHGDADDVVPMDSQRQMVDVLVAAGADVQFTVYEGVGHDSWTQTYDNPALYEWLLQHRK